MVELRAVAAELLGDGVQPRGRPGIMVDIIDFAHWCVSGLPALWKWLFVHCW